MSIKTILNNVGKGLVSGLRGDYSPKTRQASNLMLSALPAPTAGLKVLRGLKSLGSKAFNVVRSDLAAIKGMIGGGSRSIAGKILGGAGAGIAIGTAYEASRSISSGQRLTPSTIIKGAAHGAAFGLSKIGAGVGSAVGTAEGLLNKIIPSRTMSIPSTIPDVQINAPPISSPITRDDLRDIFGSIQTPQTINIMTPDVPQSAAPSFNLNMPSSGLSENLPLLLLLLAGTGGAVGYAIGKRKKKKYKKRRKHK